MESPQYSGSFFPPLMISLAGVAATSIALLTYHLLLVRYCMRSRLRDASTTFHFTPSRRGGHHSGVHGSVLKAIPILSFSSGSHVPGDHYKECVICLGELEEGDKVRLLPNCGHLFHVLCIDDWFFAHSSCPICRSPIIAPNVGDTNLGLGGDDRVDNYDHPIGQVSGSGIDQEAGNNSTQSPEEQDTQNGTLGTNNLGHGNLNESTQRNSGADVDNGLLRHSVSLVLPVEYWKPRSLVGLQRSLSLDHSFVVIDMPRESDQKGSSSCSCSCSCSLEYGNIGSGSYEATSSTRQLDRLCSSRLLRPFTIASHKPTHYTSETCPC